MLRKKLKTKKKFKRSLKKRLLIIKALHSLIKRNPLHKKIKLNKIVELKNKKADYTISIRITPNNIFCILKNNKKKTTILLVSAGLLKLKVSKKKLKFASKIIIQNYIKKILKKLKNKKVVITLTSPKKIRKYILKQLIFSLKKTKILINAENKKIFNGCRVKKRRKKKRKGMRVLK